MQLCDNCGSFYCKSETESKSDFTVCWLIKNTVLQINLKKHIYINQWYSNFNPQEVDKTEHVSTHGNLHGQLTFTRILGIDGELDWKAGGETRGQAGAAGTHLTGIMSGLNAEFERTERDIWRIDEYDNSSAHNGCESS